MEKVMENIIESYNKVDLILKKLLLCTEKEEVDALFEEILYVERNRNQNYNLFINNFIELPLRERKIITISKTDDLFKSEHVTLLNIEKLPEVHFPQYHPKVNQTYIAHPYKTDSYLPIENYDYELLNDRLNEFFYILQCQRF